MLCSQCSSESCKVHSWHTVQALRTKQSIVAYILCAYKSWPFHTASHKGSMCDNCAAHLELKQSASALHGAQPAAQRLAAACAVLHCCPCQLPPPPLSAYEAPRLIARQVTAPPGCPPSDEQCLGLGTCLQPHAAMKPSSKFVGCTFMLYQLCNLLVSPFQETKQELQHLCATMTGKRADRVALPARSTFCGVAQRGVKMSGGRESAMGRKLKMPPPPLLTNTTVKAACKSPAHQRMLASFLMLNMFELAGSAWTHSSTLWECIADLACQQVFILYHPCK